MFFLLNMEDITGYSIAILVYWSGSLKIPVHPMKIWMFTDEIPTMGSCYLSLPRVYLLFQMFFIFTPIPCEMIQFDLRIFSNGLVQPPPRRMLSPSSPHQKGETL